MLSQNDLDKRYARWSALHPQMLLTGAARNIAERGGYWVLDTIDSYQPFLQNHPDGRLRYSQFWRLRVYDDQSALLTCVADFGEPPVVEQHIRCTDFELPLIDLWLAEWDGAHYVVYEPMTP